MVLQANEAKKQTSSKVLKINKRVNTTTKNKIRDFYQYVALESFSNAIMWTNQLSNIQNNDHFQMNGFDKSAEIKKNQK